MLECILLINILDRNQCDICGFQGLSQSFCIVYREILKCQPSWTQTQDALWALPQRAIMAQRGESSKIKFMGIKYRQCKARTCYALSIMFHSCGKGCKIDSTIWVCSQAFKTFSRTNKFDMFWKQFSKALQAPHCPILFIVNASTLRSSQ